MGEKPESLYTLREVLAYMPVSGVALFTGLPIPSSSFNSQSKIQLTLKSVALSHQRDYISPSFRGEVKHSSSIKLALSPVLQRLKGLRERHQEQDFMFLFSPLG